MAEYFGQIPDDFNPIGNYGFSEHVDEWDFAEREAEMDRQFDKGLEYKSGFTLNLTKQHPK